MSLSYKRKVSQLNWPSFFANLNVPVTGTFFESSLDHKMLRHTDSAESRALIASWLRRCVNEHPACNSVKTSNYTLPTRLLDLGDQHRPLRLRLTETKALEKDCRYIALSHCWGGKISFVLTNENAESLRQGIHMSELPLNFQHAISVARFLGIRYLWVDSLCIIQDSQNDWEHEAGRMKSVYKNALLTIAATGAENSDAGLYFGRNVDLVLPLFVDISWIGLPQGVYKLYNTCLWQYNITQAPLNQRAWAVQERLLSCRVVHFGKDQIAWECQASRACESFPDEIPSFFLQSADLRFIDELHYQRATLTSFVWTEIVERYAAGGLTQEGDKCIAISGIAEEIRACTGDKYFVGMWRSCFIPQMAWTVHHLSNHRHGISPRTPSGYRAPSWSWLSIDSHIQFYHTIKGGEGKWKAILDVLDIEVELTSENAFGSIRSGHIRGCGMLRLGNFKLKEGGERILVLGGRAIESGEFFGHRSGSQFTMDIHYDDGYNNVWCLPLLKDHSQDRIGNNYLCYIGIILVETGKRKNEYKRIGCFQLKYDWGDDFLQLQGGSQHTSVLTIV